MTPAKPGHPLGQNLLHLTAKGVFLLYLAQNNFFIILGKPRYIALNPKKSLPEFAESFHLMAI